MSGIRFFIFHKVIQVVLSSLGWSSCSPSGLCRDDESWIPLGSFSGPSFLALCSNSESLARLQCLLSFTAVCDVVCQHFFVSFFRVFFMYSIQSSRSSSWLAVLSSSSVLVVFIICAVYYLSILASFVVTNLFFSRFLLLYFLFVWMMSRSILRCAFFRVLLLWPMSRHRALL